MYERQKCIEHLHHMLAVLETSIVFKNQMPSIYPERFFGILLNLAYGWDLKAANTSTENSPCIDLLDEHSRVAVQITIESSRQKIEQTLEHFFRYFGSDYRLIIFHPHSRLRNLRVNSNSTLNSFNFKIERDLLGFPDILTLANGMQLEKLSDLLTFLERELRNGLEHLYEKPDYDSSIKLLVPDFSHISLEVIAYCSRHPEILSELHWRKFEQLLDAIFRNLGYHTEIGPGSGDHGVDLRIIHKDSIGQFLTLVQAKRYKSSNSVGLQAVQALYGAVTDQRAHRGLFVTTSRYLPGVREFANSQNQRLVLADSEDVAKWCSKVTSNVTSRRNFEL